jgi:hypothetical protein
VLCRLEFRRDDDHLVVRLAGHLGEAQVPDLLIACAAEGKPPSLELDDLVSADVVGIDALLRLRQQGARFVGLPEYLALKLESVARERR